MQGQGQEVLVVDGDEKVRKGLSNLLTGADLVPTVVADPERALALSREKFFAVALVDLDTPRAGEGLSLISRIHEVSPATTVLMMASRKAFDYVVSAFRAGASDVIVKAPDQVPYLQARVVEAATARARSVATTQLVDDVLALHEEMMQLLLQTFRRAAEQEERASGDLPIDEDVSVLVVDPDSWLQTELQKRLISKGGYDFQGATTGGEALDLIGRTRFQIALVRDVLPDLSGGMVVRAIKGQSPDTISLVYTHPHEGKGGVVDVLEGSKVIPFLPEFGDPAQIAERLDELRQAFVAKSRERRVLAAFRQQHFELLRRYAELKQKLQRATAKTKT